MPTMPILSCVPIRRVLQKDCPGSTEHNTMLSTHSKKQIKAVISTRVSCLKYKSFPQRTRERERKTRDRCVSTPSPPSLYTERQSGEIACEVYLISTSEGVASFSSPVAGTSYHMNPTPSRSIQAPRRHPIHLPYREHPAWVQGVPASSGN